MLYLTALADSDGTVEFRPDRYNRDPPLIARLGGRPHSRRSPNNPTASL